MVDSETDTPSTEPPGVSDRRNRASNRVFFHAPARLVGEGGAFDARVEDISWTGVRLRLARQALGLPADAGIGSTAASVEFLLGSGFRVELDSGAGGIRLPKLVDVVRLSLPDDEEQVLDLGCLFREPLSQIEAEGLGLAMPKDARRSSDVRREADWKKEHVSRLDPSVREHDVQGAVGWGQDALQTVYVPLTPLRAVVSSSSEGAEPVVCNAESFTLNTALVRARGEMLPFNRRWNRGSVAQAAARFSEYYGDRVGLEIVNGSRRVWQGRTQVCGVEVDPGQPRDLLLHLAFGRPLLKTEIRRLRHG